MWQDQCFGMNCQARDDLSLWLQCIRPYGGSSTLSDAIRKSFLYSPKQIVIITDATFEIAPDLFYQEVIAANAKEIPLHFVVPTHDYKDTHVSFKGYQGVK